MTTRTDPEYDDLPLGERLRQTEEALRKSQHQAVAGRYAAAIMHEINNPLEAISNLVYLVQLEARDPEKVKCYAHQAEEQLRLVTMIARQTLSFYRQQSSFQDVNVIEVLEAALRIHTRLLVEKQIDIRRRLPDELVIQGNAGELLQIVSNFIANALEASSYHGRLHVRARQTQNSANITIADNGCGIPPAMRPNLFVPFNTSKGEAGTGLGLWLSKALAEKHSAQICWRTSDRAGRSGTTFRISFVA